MLLSDIFFMFRQLIKIKIVFEEKFAKSAKDLIFAFANFK